MRPKSPLTPEDVRREVEAIQAQMQDMEVAHSLEDELRLRLLRAISEGGCSDPAGCARVALTTEAFGVRRWTS